MPTFGEVFSTGGRDVQNHYQQFLTGQTAPMISPDSEPPDEAPYGGMSHSEKDISYRPGEAAPTGINGETLTPEKTAQPWPSAPSAFDRLTSHTVTDADYTDITGQQSLPGHSEGSQPSNPSQEDSANAPEL